MGQYSPIRSVAPVLPNGSIGTPVTNLPDVSGYEYKLQDISAPTAGRTEDLVAHKKRMGQAVRLELEWKALSISKNSQVMKAFNPEYVQVEYLDGLEGEYMTKIFYVGDRASPLFNAVKGRWENTTFGIVQRIPTYITS